MKSQAQNSIQLIVGQYLKAAIPVHGNCISPVFDWAQMIVIVDFTPRVKKKNTGSSRSRKVVSLRGIPSGGRANHLEQLGVEVLLCGAVSSELAQLLSNKGIRVVSGIMGEVENIIEAFRSDCISNPEFTMPGWRGCCCSSGGKRRRRHGRHKQESHLNKPKIYEAVTTSHLRLAVASGKGGTGKTTLATNLAMAATKAGYKTQLLDCDVEAPNAHLFLKSTDKSSCAVRVKIPVIDESKCTACGECGRVCEFSAVVSLKTKPLLFPELCHSCGGCVLICPEGAITETERDVGMLSISQSQGLDFVSGKMNIGEAMSPPIIKAVRANAASEGLVIIDAPPGSSCPAIEAIRGVDYVVLVTEPTPFGVNDLDIAVKTVKKLGLPFGVIINRCAPGLELAKEYCESNDIKILAEFPDDPRVREAYSRGELAISVSSGMQDLYLQLIGEIQKEYSKIAMES